MQPSGTVLPFPPFACLMVSFTGTAGAAAPQRAAAAIVSAITLWLTKGRAASWTATSLPWAATTPLRALSARVEPPFTSRTGFLQRAAARWAFSLDAPVTITSSSTSGHSSKARTLRSRTVSPPRSKLSLSNPIRVEEPAATRTAVTRYSNFLHLPHFIPALRRTAQSVLLFIEYYSVSTHKLQLPAPIKNAPVQHFWRCTGA